MKKQLSVLRHQPATVVKLGTSRQVVIPKRLHDRLGLAPGDFLAVEVKEGSVVFTPKTLVDKRVEAGLEQSLDDIRLGRIHGPFSSAQAVVRSLQRRKGRSARRQRK